MRTFGLGLAAFCAVLAGCEGGTGSGSGISGPAPTYEDIAGEYSSPVTASSPGMTLTGTMYLFLSQTGGTFTGSYAVVGTLEEGLASEQVTLLGAVVNGTLALGTNPALQMDLSPTGCGVTFVRNSGTYASALKNITLSPATIPVQDLACSGILRSVTDTLTFVQ